MATTKYTITQSNIDIAEYENYSAKDQALIDSLQINTTFDTSDHFIELHIYTLDGTRLQSDYNYTGHKQLLNSAGAGKAGASNLYLDPVADAKKYGYKKGGIKLLYHFLDNLFSEDNSRNFYIETISSDRTEVRLLSTKFSDEAITARVLELQARFANDPYFNEFRLNFGNNDLFIATNIDVENYQSRTAILVKLYEPLPASYLEKEILYLVEQISDSAQYEVDSVTAPDREQTIKLKSPNFSLDLAEESVKPTQYFNYSELFSYPVSNSYHEIYSLTAEKSIRISVDYSDFSSFVHFSSAEERLRNFTYKLNLIQSYETQLAAKKASTSSTLGISGSINYFERLITGTINNFDGYERYLYFTSESHAWPKTNTSKPYINAITASAALWYTDKIASASLYDQNNSSGLEYALPEFLKENPDNVPASIFLNMLGHHFDNIWIYSKAVTDKYDADNRLDKGISRDLVEDALKNFGVKLYTGNFSNEDLFSMFLGQSILQEGELPQYLVLEEEVSQFISASNAPNQPIPYRDYQQEVYKRIYHNLPFLIKTKGTERGVRALINCFGIPSNILFIDEFGGHSRNSSYYNGYQLPVSQSLDKVRVDNTGSIVDTTLSKFTSIQKPDEKYNQDLHVLEVGFTPAESLNNYIQAQLTSSYPTWSLDDYIGDPRDRTARSYISLDKLATTELESLGRYDLFDFVRIIRFFDNTIFKMVKDFVPARTTTSTGIIIKPHVLDRSKIQAPSLTLTQSEYSGSKGVVTPSGSSAGLFDLVDTTHTNIIISLSGSVANTITNQSARYTGELGGTTITATDKELNSENTYKVSNTSPTGFQYSNYEVTENNATTLRTSKTIHPLDVIANKVLPTNIDYILSGSNVYASIQDSNYSTSFANSRYRGKQLQGAVLNQYSAGDRSFGFEPVVNNGQVYFAYFNWLGGTSPELGNHLRDYSAANLRYLIDLDGNIISPTKDFAGINQSIVEQNFKEGSHTNLVLNSNASSTFYSLNGEWEIFKAARRVEPISYTQIAIFNNAGTAVLGFEATGSINFFDLSSPSTAGVSLDFRMINFASSTQNPIINNTIQFGTPNVLGADASWNAGGDYWHATSDPTPGIGFDHTLTFTFNLVASQTKPLNITYLVQKYTGGSWTTVKTQIINHATNLTNTITYTDALVNSGDRFRLYVDDIDDLQYSLILTANSNFRVTQSPLPQTNAASSSFWSLGTDRQYVSASNNLNQFYGQLQVDIPDSGFNQIRYPFEPQVYDELRFEGSEGLVFKVLEVNFVNGILVLKLDRAVPVGTDTDFYLLRRYEVDPSYVIVNVDKPSGATPGGTLRPKFMPAGSEKKIEAILKDLRSQNLL